mmetsp:Transcript_921/g.1631  ORF Transcript_921/g.1631 Transcript_921/m.1631 type:complete len:123 (-) Transcript_921:682-1050(-)
MTTGRLPIVNTKLMIQYNPPSSLGCLNWMIEVKSTTIFIKVLIQQLNKSSACGPAGIQYQKSPLIIFTIKYRARSAPMYANTHCFPTNPSSTIQVHLIKSIPAEKKINVTNIVVLLLDLAGM